jgi:DHA2 family methylenomycin A resistance protein-like MFS transporter
MSAPPARSGITLFVGVAGQFLAVSTSTTVGVALPSIGRDLEVSSTVLQWVVSAYVIVFASLLVAGGVVGDRRGVKGTFLAGMAIFGLGSLACGLAHDTGTLLAARVLQGMGPALMAPCALALLSATFPDPAGRARAIGLWSAGAGVAMATGPALGGVMVDALGWRWVFLFNVPLCALIFALGALYVPRVRTVGGGPFDRVGALLTTAGLAALIFGIIEGRGRGWDSPLIVGAFVAAVVIGAAFVRWERAQPAPLVDVALFRRPGFVVASGAALVVFFALIGMMIFFSAFFQDVQGRSAVDAGLCVLPVGVGEAVVAALTARMVPRFGARRLMVTGLVTAGVATLGLLQLDASSTFGSVWWNFAIVGAGIGLALPPLTTSAMAAVERGRLGMASAVHNAMRQVGQVLGVAVLGTLVYSGVRAGVTAEGRLSEADTAAFVSGLHNAFAVAGAALLVAAVVAAAVLPPDRDAPKPGDRRSRRVGPLVTTGDGDR